MKKSFYFFMSLLIVLALFSCSNDEIGQLTDQKMVELTKNEVLSISYYDPEELQEKDIFNIVKSFAEVESGGLTRSSNTMCSISQKTYINKQGEFEDKIIATKSQSESDDVTSVICNVEIKNGSNKGLAVVSIDGKLPSVLAYIPEYNEETFEKSGAKELVHASKASYLYKSIQTKKMVDSLRIPTLEKISLELDIPIEEITYERIQNNIILTDATPSTRVTAVPRQPIGVQKLPSSIDPMVKTNWGQDDPYNGYFYQMGYQDWVAVGNGSQYQSVPAGCVNIAIAQMMTHTHRYSPLQLPIPGANMNFSPDWSSMTKYPNIDHKNMSGTGFFHAQYLICHLYGINNTTSVKNSMGWVTDSSVAEDDMLRTMSRYFKYDSKADFNGDRAWAALRNQNLVLMLTSDHAFVISGILITELASMTRQLVKTNDVYWHANLGWANECTGYYQLDHNANTYFEAGSTNEWCYKMDYLNNIRTK